MLQNVGFTRLSAQNSTIFINKLTTMHFVNLFMECHLWDACSDAKHCVMDKIFISLCSWSLQYNTESSHQSTPTKNLMETQNRFQTKINHKGQRILHSNKEQKFKNKSTIWFSYSTPWQTPTGLSILLHKCLLSHTTDALLTTARKQRKPGCLSTD